MAELDVDTYMNKWYVWHNASREKWERDGIDGIISR